jgi:hypothetical protein
MKTIARWLRALADKIDPPAQPNRAGGPGEE